MYTNTTEHCKEVISRSSRTFAAYFLAGNEKYTGIKSLKVSVPSTSNGQITMGGTVSNSIEVILAKIDISKGTEIEVYEGVKLDDGTYEEIPLGKYKITKALTKESLTTVTAEGPLSTETRLGYFSELSYPATTKQMLEEISGFIEVPIITEGLEEIYVETKPEGYLYREIIGYIAALHGKNAYETRDGSIVLKWYEHCAEDIFTDKIASPELDNNLFTINRFECTTGTENITRGEGTTGISISNPLMTEAAADIVWNKVSGYKYRPGTFNIKSGTPSVDPWDSFTYNDEEVICTELEYVHDGGLQNVYKSSGTSETGAAGEFKGPMVTAMERYLTELLIVKDIAAKSMTVNEADIRYAQIAQLDAIETNITTAVVGTIDGRYATFDYLANNYTVMSEFEALSGKVTTLDAEALRADSAIIAELETNINRTNTLIFGSASGSVIQTEFSNSVIAQLGSAQIKSAMIESLAVDKLLSGTIYTDDITIQSKSGNMILTDNTLLISDGKFVRVQVGKDASNDYSINVWDASGNLMWSQGGITENAIKEAIIRNDMVSENANISASKLDIDSLFTEINGSSNTIKSTKIYLDDKAQTLDVAFESMITDVVALQTKQSSQGTLISTLQGQLSSKIWKEDITIAVEDIEDNITELNTQYSGMSQKLNSITALVAQHTKDISNTDTQIETISNNYSSLDITVSGINTTVGSHTTSISGLTTRVSTAESKITQLSDEVDLRVEKNGIIAAINLTKETVLIDASKINLIGKVTISALDSGLTTTINDATSNAVTALSTANSALETAKNTTPFIVGTQTAATGTWKGVAPFSKLVDGQQITYWLPYAGSGNATLNLTLADGTTTGAKNCYYGGATRLTTHYAAGSAIRLTYRSSVVIGSTTYSGWWADANYDSGNTYDRTRYNAAIKASGTVAAGNIIVGNSSGYHNLKTGGTFDISYPILYAGSAIASNGSGTNNYIIINMSIATTQSLTLTAYKSLYIKGTLSGSTFTPISTAPITQTIPTAVDGYYYILLGTATSTTAFYLMAEHPIFQYINGSFQQISTGANGTANTALSTANTASSNAAVAVSTANTASSNASTALTTANTANTNASSALSTATIANTTANTALATANTANTNATNAVSTANVALLKSEVETIIGNVKKFKNVCGYTSDTANVKGYLIITTPITPSKMVSLHISGYNYVGERETIDITIGFYNYASSFVQNGFVNKGSFPISSVKVAKVSSSDTRAVIIIGTATTVWQYPKIIVDEVITGYSTVAPDSYKDGFSATITATLPTTYVQTITLAGTDLTAISIANDLAIANWCYNNDTTFIDGANIYAGTITSVHLAAGSVTADKIDVNDLFAQNIAMSGVFTATGKDWMYPTKSDYDLIKEAYLGQVTLTSAQIQAFDINESGAIDLVDLAAIKKMLLGAAKIEEYVTKYGYSPIDSEVTAKINPSDVEKTIHIYGTNSFGTYVESYFGINTMKTTTAVIDGATIGELDITGELTVAGDVTFAESLIVTGSITSSATISGGRIVAGYDSGVANSVSCSGWFRSSGQTGWYNTTYSGGWYMTDTSWVKSYANKGVYTEGTMKAGALVSSGTLSVTGTATLSSTLTVASTVTIKSGLELYHATPYIDFHYGNSTVDYTSRIIESASGTLKCSGNWTVGEKLTVTGQTVLNNTLTMGAGIVMPNGSSVAGKNTSGTAYAMVYLNTSNNMMFGNAAVNSYFNGTSITFRAGSGNTEVMKISTTSVYPVTTNNFNLGTSTYRWKYIYSNNALQTSDRRHKSCIENLDNRYVALRDKIIPYRYYLEDNPEYSIGFIAQDVEQAMYAVGLTNAECAFVHKEWVATDDYVGYEYMLDYNFVSVLNHLKINDHEERIKELENKLIIANVLIENLQQQLWALS